MTPFVFAICILSLHIDRNKYVRSVSNTYATNLMQRWCLEIKMNDDDITSTDGDTDLDYRVTDDSLNGPFKLVHIQENSDILIIHRIIKWIETNTFNSKKGVFVAIIDNQEKMLGFVENHSSIIQVNGFLAYPFIDNQEHIAAQSMLVLELIDMAHHNKKNIKFLFS